MDSRTDTSVGTRFHGTCKRVLLVDSNPSSRVVTQSRLLAENYTVTATGSGIQALAILHEHNGADFDFVLTDIHLSDIDGFEFLDILEKESNAIVFVLSADHREEAVQQSFNKGVCMFYGNPIAKEYVDELWRIALNVKQGRQSQGKGKEKLQIDEDKELFTGIWTSGLHDRFVQAIKVIGLRYADGKKILEFMDVSGLTKKDVSDHLRKYFRSLMKMEQAIEQQAQENQDSNSSFKRVRRW